MKKVLWLIVCLMTMVFTSCTTYVASAEYEVCYPDGTQKCDGSIFVNSNKKPWVTCYSIGGSNYIAAIDENVSTGKKTSNIIYSSTAPIRLNSYKVEKYKDKKH